MTDTELLELAAKAAGSDYEVDPDTGSIEILDQIGGMSGAWNPLTDDGDALRLAVACFITVRLDATSSVSAEYGYGHDKIVTAMTFAECRGDKKLATRRAIVRIAAEIGRALS